MSQSFSNARTPGPAGGEIQLERFDAATDAAALPGAVDAALGQLQAVASELEGRPDALLALLRSLEQLHRSIQDGPFRSSLPADRNALFQLLSEMERSGGWPYIPRLQLRTFLDLLSQGAGAEGSGGAEPEGSEPSEEGHGASSRLAA
jgi:hypothetical protein